MAATEAPEEAQACRDPVASAEVSGAAATESKVTGGQGAESRELADEADKAPVKEAPAVTEQPDMQPKSVSELTKKYTSKDVEERKSPLPSPRKEKAPAIAKLASLFEQPAPESPRLSLARARKSPRQPAT